MAQHYRQQNESGRWQDPSRSGQRNYGGRDRFEHSNQDRYETGQERRYSPDWDERFFEGSQHEGGAFEGDRSYSASGYPEEFGYRREGRESYGDRFGGSEGQQRTGGYSQSYGGRNELGGASQFGGSGGQRYEQSRNDPRRGGYFGSGYGSGSYGTGSYGSGSDYGMSQQYGSGGRGYGGRDYGSERNWGGDSGSQSQQSHRGRGPKGYERSDERIKELICERLTDDPAIDASEVTVDVNNKVVRLTGTVDDRRTKYLIEDVIEHCGGVRDIDNQLRVQTQGSQSQSGQQGTSGAESGYRSNDRTGSLGTSGTSATTPGSISTKRN